MKRHFGYAQVRYRGLAKNRTRLCLLFGFANLLLAARRGAARIRSETGDPTYSGRQTSLVRFCTETPPGRIEQDAIAGNQAAWGGTTWSASWAMARASVKRCRS